ncbi:MAG TPA: sodium:solute symporter [Bryobacteraceae bacterium]|nr:sodium:solute symporter [Bryobacteraceae bacterium]
MRYIDLGVILAYLALITWFGAHFRKGQKNLRDYVLGGRTAPWWAIALSIVSAETSTLTIVGTPALSFTGNLGFLQVVFGYLLARIVISLILLPHYFRGEMFTAYELMRRRFGEPVRGLTASIFLVTRALAEGVRVFAVSLVVSIVLGTGEVWSIVLILVLTLVYTFEGGMTAVIWTDVVQMCLYVVGAVTSFFVILSHIPGGWGHVLAVAGGAGKFQLLDFHWSAAAPYTFWAGVIGGCFLTMASHGTDQLMVQRLLSARDLRQSRTALLGSWAVIFVQFGLFLLIGVLLFVYYRDRGLRPPAEMDRIYPEFLWRNLAPGVAGITIAAILAAAMANLSAALNSLAATTVVDFFRSRDRQGAANGNRSLWQARAATVAWAGVLLAIGILARRWGSVLEAGLTIASIPSGALLGVFLLGVLTRKPGGRAAVAGVVAGLAGVLYIRFRTPVAFTWYVVVGACVTFCIGLAASVFERAPQKDIEFASPKRRF